MVDITETVENTFMDACSIFSVAVLLIIIQPKHPGTDTVVAITTEQLLKRFSLQNALMS